MKPTIEKPLPYATPEDPGIGGVLKAEAECFVVEEMPLYEPEAPLVLLPVRLVQRLACGAHPKRLVRNHPSRGRAKKTETGRKRQREGAFRSLILNFLVEQFIIWKKEDRSLIDFKSITIIQIHDIGLIG